MGADEIRSFLSHLAVTERVSASTQNQALCALLFLYGRAFGVDIGPIGGSSGPRHRNGYPWC